MESNLTRTGIATGTTGYMSPEQIRKEELDGRSDLFSLGMVLYEMATGRRAFTGETAVVVQEAILTKTPPPVETLNAEMPGSLGRSSARPSRRTARSGTRPPPPCGTTSSVCAGCCRRMDVA